MAKKRISRIQRKTTNRGRFASFTVHLILLLLAFLPFLSFHAPEPPTKEALVLQFDYPYNQYIAPEKFVEPPPPTQEIPPVEGDLSESSKLSGSEAGGNEVKSPEPVQSRPQESAPAALATQSKPAALKSSTPTSPITSAASDIPMTLPKIYTASTAKSNEWATIDDVSEGTADNVKEMRIIDSGSGGFGNADVPGGGDGDSDSGVSSEGFGQKPGGGGGTGNGSGNTSGNGSGPGGGTGTGNAGNKTGVGNNGLGYQTGLDGLLNRKMIHRAEVAKLSIKEGQIAFYICVDRSGKVVGTKYDVVKSTLKDPEFIKKAEAVAMEYLFAEDQSAPERQCGKMTFIFKLPK